MFMSEHVNTYKELENRIIATGKPYNLELIKSAYEFANIAHKDQLRKSGEPYISHPIAVASILLELGMDGDSLTAALLHDVVEDTEASGQEVEKLFGKEVYLLVDGLTKLEKIPFSSKEEQQAENIRKMLLAIAQDVRVVIIKLADRLHNARTFEFLSEEKARYKALETMEIYAPLAQRLGIRALKEELEDISLRFLDNVAYKEIEDQLNLRADERQNFIDKICSEIYERVKLEHPNAQVTGRVKSIYGIYRKVYMNGRAMSDVFDVYAIRVIVNSVIECYNILGIIHDMYRPIPSRFKDYISTPKQNMYQSLHTSVFGVEGTPFETQIRTWDMHHTAEYGIAAHWKYKAGITGKDKLEERMAWVRQLIETQQDSDDAEEIVRTIKTDIAQDEVFVYTPKGDIKSLPAGSTIVDYAYSIHTQIGNRMSGALVDGRMVGIDYVVQTGDVIEVLTSNKSGGPSRDWLNIARTTDARAKIRNWFKREQRDENVKQGREAVEREFKRYGIHLNDTEMQEFLEVEAKRQHQNTIDDFYASIGYGGISLSRILPRLKDYYLKEYAKDEQEDQQPVIKQRKEHKDSSGVIVDGIEGCRVKFAKCCNPLPGDDIVGFITRGFGVSVHKKNCPNAGDMSGDGAERWVRTSWASTIKESFQSSIDIVGTNRDGLLADVTVALKNLHISIHSLMAKELKDGRASFRVTISITDINQFNFVASALNKINGVSSVDRV